LANIAFIAHGLTSPLNAGLELSRRLRDGGHRVTFLSHADIGEVVRAHGFAFVRLNEPAAMWPPGSGRIGPGAIAQIPVWRRMRKESIETDQIERAVAAIDPDLLLIDIEMHYPVIATASLGIPTMLVMNWLSIYRLPDLPPLNSKLAPGDAAEIERAWRRVRMEAIGARLRHKLSRHGVGDVLRPVSVGTRFYADLKQVARFRGYPLRATTDRKQWLRPYMYTRLPVLCLNAYELEFPHTPHRNITYAGPMVNRHRVEGRVDAANRQRWEEFKERRAGSSRPLVYCSLGSYWSDLSFLRMVLATFARRPDWDLVLGLGGQVTPGEIGPITPNVLTLDYAPQLEVLAEAACAINHGGITSINECIAHEVPMIVYSPGLLDQDGCAARVAYHGLGIGADWESGDPADLERHIAQVLASSDMRDRLRAMRTAYDRYENDGVAVRAIEQHLASPPGK
jgi:UDP:flavonoid glycosyltransferase YjiC (YdhE family)